jgi:lipopolysaccharide transport system ATP-binding protein
MAAAVEVEGVSKRFRLYHEKFTSLKERILHGGRVPYQDFWALRDIDLRVETGESIGLLGHNGSGKSTLLKCIAGILRPTAGEIRTTGRMAALLELGAGFQPDLSGRENVFLNASILGMKRAEIERRFDDIIGFAGEEVERMIDNQVKYYSSGMYVRLGFAVAINVDPEILLVDEVLAVGDAEFQRKCLGRMAEIGATGRTVLFVSHSMPSLLRLCPRLILLDRGGVVADGVAHEVVRTYLESGLATAAERTWPSPDLAPGDDTARLKAVRVRTDGGEITDELDIRRPVSIEVEYWHLAEDPAVRPSVNLHFYNEDGVCLFLNNDFNDRAWWQSPRRPGVVKATCRIPGNLLAEGRIYVTAVVSTYNPTVVHAEEKEAVAFQVVDRSSGAGDGVRGPYVGDWPGAVRPMRAWTIDPPPPA